MGLFVGHCCAFHFSQHQFLGGEQELLKLKRLRKRRVHLYDRAWVGWSVVSSGYKCADRGGLGYAFSIFVFRRGRRQD